MARVDTRAAALGSDATELSAMLARALSEASRALADEAVLVRQADSTMATRAELREAAAAYGSLAQAAATGLLAARVAELVEVVRADVEAAVSARGSSLPMPTAAQS